MAFRYISQTMKDNTMSNKKSVEARPSQKKSKMLVFLNTCLKAVNVLVLLFNAAQKCYEAASKFFKLFE